MGTAAKQSLHRPSYAFGEGAQVDWYEAYANFAGDEQKVYVFCTRSMASGPASIARICRRHNRPLWKHMSWRLPGLEEFSSGCATTIYGLQ